MQSPIIGGLMWVVLMHGARFIALTTIKNAVVVSFVLPVFGVPLEMRWLMPNKLSASLITASAIAERMRNKP